jgi:GNAT superfamily N-acetyltransferase
MFSASDFEVRRYSICAVWKGFQCEKEGFSDFVTDAAEAEKFQKENLGVTYGFWKEETPIGYVTLAMASLQRKELPSERKENKPYRHVPSLLIGQMARDERHRGRGVGKIMVDFVIATANALGKDAGCRFVIVDAERDQVGRYEGFGFEALPADAGDRTVLMFFDLGLRD